MNYNKDKRQNNNPDYRKYAFSNVFGRTAWYPNVKNVDSAYRNFLNYVKSALNSISSAKSLAAPFSVEESSKEFELGDSNWYYINNDIYTLNGNIIPEEELEIAKKYGAPEKLDVNKLFIDGLEQKFHVSEDKILFQNNSNLPSVKINSIDQSFVSSRYKPSIISIGNISLTVSNNKFTYNGDLDFVVDSKYEFIKIECNSIEKKKGEIVLKLEENLSNDNLSVFDIFFSDIEEYTFDEKNRGTTYRRRSCDRDKGTLIFRFNDKKEESKFKDDIRKYNKIYISDNSYQLKMQEAALQTLINRPNNHMRPIIDLCDDINRSTPLTPVRIVDELLERDYMVLTDASRDGTSNQREFVNRSLNTKDFMILEGPPGSGKTTAILELILQLMKRGKKVILVASTHVAVDNVLERLVEREEFTEYINPIRIGDENLITSESVKQFQIGNIKKEVGDEYWSIASDSFNIVCGTTIGVLKYQKINEQFGSGNTRQLIDPIFDYMILDEASKTTFMDFMVPALFAKRWIIIGDTMQLSPFIDDRYMSPTLLQNKPLNNPDVRDSLVFLLTKNQITNKGSKNELYHNKAFLLSSGAINNIDSKSKDEYVIVSSTKYKNNFSITFEDIKNNSINCAALYAGDNIVLIEENNDKNVLENVFNKLNPKFVLYKLTGDYYNSNSKSIMTYRTSSKNRDNNSNNKKIIDMLSKKVEDEITWRLARIYELINNKDTKTKDWYEKWFDEFDLLLSDNEKEEFKNQKDTIIEIAIPSIITLLKNGAPNKAKSKNKTMITEGLNSKFPDRFVMLEYQHRMHEDISKLPRNYVYDGQALKNARGHKTIEYHKEESRNIFINVNGESKNNVNHAEVKAIVKEVKEFCSFANKEYSNRKEPVSLIILSFYKAQVTAIRHAIKQEFNSDRISNILVGNVLIKIENVDKIQGQEGDVVMLSLTQTARIGFMDSITRVNVAITRARSKMITFGKKDFYKNEKSEFLKRLITEAEERK